jgi:hypothetical protein
MSLYVVSLTVPPQTSINKPVSEVLIPLDNHITEISMMYPDGCLGTVGIRFLDYGAQFAPLPSGRWITGNDNILRWRERRRLSGSPHRLIIEGYSDALDYPHTIEIKMEIV